MAHPIVAEQCSQKVLQSKIEIKLKKQDDIRWLALEKKIPVVQQAEKPSPSGEHPILKKTSTSIHCCRFFPWIISICIMH